MARSDALSSEAPPSILRIPPVAGSSCSPAPPTRSRQMKRHDKVGRGRTMAPAARPPSIARPATTRRGRIAAHRQLRQQQDATGDSWDVGRRASSPPRTTPIAQAPATSTSTSLLSLDLAAAGRSARWRRGCGCHGFVAIQPPSHRRADVSYWVDGRTGTRPHSRRPRGPARRRISQRCTAPSTRC